MIDSLFKGIEEAGLAAAEAAMTRGAAKIASRAKAKAPVRKVFEGQGDMYRTRLKSISMIEADRKIRAQLHLSIESTHINPPSIVSRRAPRVMSLRKMAGAGLADAGAQSSLDSRGRYELKSGRAVHKGQLGGRLRSEIYFIAASRNGRIITARVVSPTEYAKYQEFGTAHTPAHPYMRPAAYESKEEIVSDIASSVSAAAREAAQTSVRLTATWHLKS